MASFATRDQENLTNAHQQAAALKPLNQGSRALQPKTPGQKAFQTPFRGKGNDENAAFTVKGGKAGGAKNAPKENLQLTIGKGKQAARTPVPQTQARNALAPKTTNAKARAAQTPGPLGLKQGTVQKTNQRPASLRKNKVRNELNQDTKLQIPVDLEECPSPEIEQIHPRPPDMEDIDDDFPPLDLSYFDPAQGGINVDELPYMTIREHAFGKDADGLSFLQRQAKRKQEREDILERRTEAEIVRNANSALLTCYHNPECVDGQCKDWPDQLRQAQEQYEKTMANLLLPEEREAKAREEAQNSKTIKARPLSKGPSDTASKRAASALSMRVRPDDLQSRPKSRGYEKPWLAGAKAAPAPAGHASRHAASVAASRTTLGFRKGRTASANVNGGSPAKQESREKSDTETLKELFQEVEERKREEQGDIAEPSAKDFVDEEAEQDFVLTL